MSLQETMTMDSAVWTKKVIVSLSPGVPIRNHTRFILRLILLGSLFRMSWSLVLKASLT